MTRKVLLVVVVGVFLCGGVPASAHHSQNAQFDTSKVLTMEVTLVQLAFRNPHSFLQVETPGENGSKEPQRWSIEWGNAIQLSFQGVDRNKLHYGDILVITANPSRTPNDHKLHLLTIRRPSDGFGWGTKPGENTEGTPN
jgi:hypothetical protein